MRSRIFFSIFLGFITGVLLRSFIFLNIYYVLFVTLVSFLLFLFFKLVTNNKWGVILLFFSLTFSLGILRFHIKDTLPIRIHDESMGSKSVVEGIIVEDPEDRENSQRFVVEENVSDLVTRILVTTNLGDDFKYGDFVKLEGAIEKPENFETDQGKNFDYVNYLRKDGIFYVMYYPKVELVSRGNGNKFKSFLYSAKDKFLEKINFVVPSPENLLMGGLILGERSPFSQELRNDFVTTGTIHIVALSGYNITIISEWLMKLFSFLPRALGVTVGVSSILLFVLMTGASSTAIRAGIMAIIVLIGRYTGRTYEAGRALILAGVLMILINPFILLYDVSFQLSFLATIALIFFTPRFEKYFSFVTERFQLREIVSVTVAVYIFVLPFILYKMGNLSLVSIPANILILPFIPLTMLFGFLAAFLGMIWYGFSVPFGLLSSLFLRYELSVIEFFANIPFASFTISNFPLLLTVAIYAYFVYTLWGEDIKKFFTEPF